MCAMLFSAIQRVLPRTAKAGIDFNFSRINLLITYSVLSYLSFREGASISSHDRNVLQNLFFNSLTLVLTF